MSGDIAVQWNNLLGRGDFFMAGADLGQGADLQSAFLLSIFTDAPAKDDDVIPDGSTDRRGWWGDDDPNDPYPTGSRLWLLERSKLTDDVAKLARDYAAEALQWMLDDGVVADFSFSTTIRHPGQLWLTVTAYRTKGNRTATNFAWTWTGIVLISPTPS